jgi:hypothetical protein
VTPQAAVQSGATKTFSDRPADAAPKAAEGWAGSPLQHVDPKANPQPTGDAASVIRAERPATAAGSDLRTIETIPTPAGREPAVRQAAPAAGAAGASTGSSTAAPSLPPAPSPAPTVAPLGPAVEPAPPTGTTAPVTGGKDVPAAETSRRLLRIVPSVDAHTT